MNRIFFGSSPKILPSPKVEMRGDFDPLFVISVFIVWQMLCSSSTEPSVMRYICGSASWTLDSNAIALNQETSNSMNNKTKGYYKIK